MTYRQIHTELWDDSWVIDLSPNEKLLFIYLFSNSRTNTIGLYELTERKIAFDTGLPLGTVAAGLARFQADKRVYYQDSWLWVPRLLTRNINNLSSPKIRAMIERQLTDVPNDCPFKADWILYFNQVVVPQYGIDTLSISIDTMSPPQIHSVLWCDCVDPVSVSESVEEAGNDSNDERAMDAWVKVRGGAVNPLDVAQINDLVDEFETYRQALPRASPGVDYPGEQWVKSAILEANSARKTGAISLNYIKAILDRWKTEGYQAPFGGIGKQAADLEEFR